MGNATTKLNRKFDGWLKKAYYYIFKEEELSEISDEELSQDEENGILEELQQVQEPLNKEKEELNHEPEEGLNTPSQELESIICTSITKEELLQDKRKASTLLLTEFEPKRICLNKEA
ncbi:unnamed protein product (macronuclear) [Paramecium tetraurelia]|uniref:Uncharacterized protein n=1 Tax=Paramecium tetraurelia TaxID=5888 RepID=A0DC32_PARTE|nr:uncharacterized protein GSPATT00015476001 [Paramecium tetraurelia]CAK80599.1 unnamed protein product [Paramecium tetraurelia]|eukprot:XP_001447996.1 hypothetical protein (macronuclear) [Paramecium tetraurelia strain d4-2]